MRKLLFDYEAPKMHFIEMVLENGIAFTISKESSDIIELEEGDGWGDY